MTKNKRIFLFFFVIALVASSILVISLFTGCGANKQPSTEAGSPLLPGWQTYINNKYGIQIQWPGDWKTGGPDLISGRKDWFESLYGKFQPKPEEVLKVWGPQGGEVYTLFIYPNVSKLDLLTWIHTIYDPKQVYNWEPSKETKGAIEVFEYGRLRGEWSDLPFPLVSFYRTSSGYIVGYQPPQDEVLDLVYSNQEDRNKIRGLMVKYGLKFK